MGRFIAADDLTPFAAIDSAKAEAMIADAEATALLVAPCLYDPAIIPETRAAVRAILRAAILRWEEAGNGSVSQQTAGPFSQSTDTRQVRKGMFWPSEIEQLQAICQPARTSGGAFSVIPARTTSAHLPWCDLAFGGTGCSCGTAIAGHPIYELG